MTVNRLRTTFLVFRLTVGAIVFYDSVRTVIGAVGAGGETPLDHLALLAGIEAIAAVAFLVPKTLRIGGIGLLVVFLVAGVVHAVSGDLPGPLLVYAAAVLFIVVHGPGVPRAERPGSARVTDDGATDQPRPTQD